MPPVLDPTKSKVDGLAFLGLSLSRQSDEHGHPDSQTHQTAFDLNDVLDRSYEHVFSTNDDGWLVGGGEPPRSYKLAAKDSAHVEIMRIGTFEPRWGGISQAAIVDVLRSGKILIPEMRVVPTAVVANGDVPPELEIRFDMADDNINDSSSIDDDALPVNWQLRFVHNQLFYYFHFPSRFCPGAFHSTIVRKAEFRSKDHEKAYFDKCAKAVAKWRQAGPQPLLAQDRSGIEAIYCKPKSSNYSIGSNHCSSLAPLLDMVDDLFTPSPADDLTSGIYLFRDRNTITHYFAPNFRPDTVEKKRLVRTVLAERWDEQSLSWRHSGVNAAASARNDPDSSSTASNGNKDSPNGKLTTMTTMVEKRADPHDEDHGANVPKSRLYKFVNGSATAAASAAVSAKSVVNNKQKRKEQQRGRPRDQKPVQPPPPPLEQSSSSSSPPPAAKKLLRSGLFKLHRTPQGIVEEIPAAAE